MFEQAHTCTTVRRSYTNHTVVSCSIDGAAFTIRASAQHGVCFPNGRYVSFSTST